MTRYCLCFVCLLLGVCHAVAQQPGESYYPYAEPEEYTPILRTDSTLFFRAIQTASDLYGELTSFNLPVVALRRRGQDFGRETITAQGIAVSYRYTSALRLLGAFESFDAGIAPASDAIGSTGGIRSFRLSDQLPLLPYAASVRFTDRNYLFGAKVSAHKQWGERWRGVVGADFRTGRDLHAPGVFTNALSLGLSLSRHWGEGHALTFLAIIPPAMRGTRLSSVEEAFDLTGDRLYNPAWGFQQGQVRNARVRRELVPLGLLTYIRPLGASTSLAVTLGVETGIRKYSSLGWYDARTPMPDNYRYMPSYTGDRENFLAWCYADPQITQIDWDGLIARNRMAGGHAVYTLEDRVERLRRLNGDIRFVSSIDDRLTLRYGAFFAHHDARFYKQMRDLLGAAYITDIDQYLIDDDAYGNLLQNDLRHPDRTIRVDDRFGYDYALTLRRMGVRFQAEYRADRLRADVAVEIEDAAVVRHGYFEKELFPRNGSFGASRRLRFTPYTVKALVGWAFSPRRYVGLTALAAAVAPDPEDLFYQPQYNNRTIDNLEPEQLYGVEANYTQTGRVLDLRMTAFFTVSFDETQTRRYFDDLSGTFADMAVTGISRGAYGLEAAAEVRLAYRWRMSLAASAGSYKFIRNPRVTVLSDVDNSLIDDCAESYMGGCQTGGAPQITALAGVGYFGPKGWGLRLSAGYAGGRFVEPAPLRRTERVARQGGVSADGSAAFTTQERLDDAFTLDAALFKRFYLGHSSLTATLMLRNLTGGQPLYDGYESLRIMRRRMGDSAFWLPQPSRYTYSYPRSFYLTISYKF